MMAPRANQRLQANNASLYPTSVSPLKHHIPLLIDVEHPVVFK